MNKTPFIALAALLAAGGVVNNVSSITAGNKKPESWLEDHMPTAVGDYTLEATGGSKVSYRMDKSTYEELDPIGIAAQRFKGPAGAGFDAVTIAGDGMKSFHDQRWCFNAQGWTIVESKETVAPTKAFGNVPVTLVKIERASTGAQYAVFTLRGPSGFHSDIPSASKDWFWYEFLKMKKYTGFFYRVMPTTGGMTADQVLTFTGSYIDAANDAIKDAL
ncbi:MAG: hypothetical protein JST30_05975 [Armatimonadetes bacterium]|nr:hypothetical protein [Armatimonadota bacterium]